MASLTIRNLDDRLKGRLRVRAASRGRSMEEEARHILRDALHDSEPQTGIDLFNRIRARFVPLGGVDLPVIEREPGREPPSFDEWMRSEPAPRGAKRSATRRPR